MAAGGLAGGNVDSTISHCYA
ncbi:MAG: hypothetical protein HY695_03555 [Deltaproteobacteria bacterium]|nr:hypothetical protein [Deltaproteobacteria bacterium]